jgi:hypothetical protein
MIDERMKAKQMLVRIITNQKVEQKSDQEIAYRLMEQANSKGYNISKMKICNASNNDDVKIVIFEVFAKPEEKFPGCFRIHRKSQYDTFYTINALSKVKERYASDEEAFQDNANKLLTLFQGEVVEYNLITTSCYVRNGDKLEKVQ